MSSTDGTPHRTARRRLWLAALLCLGLAVWAGWTAWQALRPAASATIARPALHQVDFPNGGRLFLFGAVHLLPPGIDWLRGPVEQAALRSDLLVLEVAETPDAGSSAAYTRLAMQPGMTDIAARLPPDLRDDWQAIRRGGGVDPAVLAHMDDWAAALAIAREANMDSGLSAASGVDAVLRDRFVRVGRPVLGLETAVSQLALFDALPTADAQAMLAQAVAGFGDARADTAAMLAHWSRGDEAALLAGATEGILARPAIRAALLDRRNAAWADRLAAMQRPGKTLFVAVGAAHLGGPGGLPALLAGRGAQVRRIQ